MTARYFVSTPIESDHVQLAGNEAHHLTNVMRASVGTQVILFDGSGREFIAEVRSVSRQTIGLRIISEERIDRELPFALTLAVSLPKGDRQRWLIEKSVELGVSKFVPLLTERGVAQPTEKATQRLRRVVIEASKQCGRNSLMLIDSPKTLAQINETSDPGGLRLIAHPGGAALPAEKSATHWQLAIGPEGGFNDDELMMAKAGGWQTVDLGPRILRIETAAISLVSAITIG